MFSGIERLPEVAVRVSKSKQRKMKIKEGRFLIGSVCRTSRVNKI